MQRESRYLTSSLTAWCSFLLLLNLIGNKETDDEKCSLRKWHLQLYSETTRVGNEWKKCISSSCFSALILRPELFSSYQCHHSSSQEPGKYNLKSLSALQKSSTYLSHPLYPLCLLQIHHFANKSPPIRPLITPWACISSIIILQNREEVNC